MSKRKGTAAHVRELAVPRSELKRGLSALSHKELERLLIQSEKLAAIGLIAGGLAHELNNPLGGILLFAQNLLLELPKKSQHYADVKEIETATLHCKHIVCELLTFLRHEPATKQTKSANVTEALQSALHFSKMHQRARSVEVHEDFAKGVDQVHGDQNALVQLFLNIVQNALQAMPQGGTLTLRSYRFLKGKTSWGAWEICDTGVGIDERHKARLFTPFFTTKAAGDGTGLGLFISQKICQQHRGTLEIESEKNTGTTCRIAFPLLQTKLPIPQRRTKKLKLKK